MRIVFFTDTYHPSSDGVVRSIDLFERGLRADGHQVHICAPGHGASTTARASASLRDPGGFRLTLTPSLPFPPYPQYRIPVWTSKSVEASVRFSPDLIHSHAMVGMGLAAREAAEKISCPLIGTFHTLVPSAAHYIMPIPALQGWTGERMWDYLRWFYSPFDKVLTPSAFMRDKLAEQDIKADVMPNPVDTDFFKKTKNSKPSSTASSSRLPRHSVLFLGRVAKEKDLDFLLDMAATREWRAWGAELLIAGDGPYRKHLEARAKKEGLASSVRFLGRVPEARLPALFSFASCTIQPSTFETQGLTALESMACGTPAVVKKDTALAEVVRPGKSGEWMDDDVREAVDIVRGVCERKAKYASSARKLALEYSVPKCTARLLGVYRSEL